MTLAIFGKKLSNFLTLFFSLLFFSQPMYAANAGRLSIIQSLDKLSIEVSPSDRASMPPSLKIKTDQIDATLNLSENFTFTRDLNISKTNELLFYEGEVVGASNSWVRLTYNAGIYTGAFYDGYDLFFVNTLNAVSSNLASSQINKLSKLSGDTQVIYKADDIRNYGKCALEVHDHENSAFNYQNFVKQLSNMTANMAAREITIKLVADTEYDAIPDFVAEERMLQEMFVANGIFSSQLNVELTVIETEVLSVNGNLTTTDPEGLVVAFRESVENEISNYGLMHLFTGKNLTGDVVGIAYVNALCTRFGVGLTQNLQVNTALVLAHELGHNFGSRHDNFIINDFPSCLSSRAGFLMSPRINGSDTFSQCSLDVMENGIQIGNFITNNQCVVPTSPINNIAPSIESLPSLNASVGKDYLYDNDSKVEVSGTDPISFALDIAPPGMNIDEAGVLSWLPEQTGVEDVQLRAFNAFGEDIQSFSVSVADTLDSDIIDFTRTELLSYGGEEDQESNGVVSIQDGGATVELNGNRWQRINYPFEVTSSTILEFDFRSIREGEVHAIGFDDDLVVSSARAFQIYGTENLGITDFSYSGSGDFESFYIPIGQYFTGNMSYLFFAMDHDVAAATGNSSFRNIKVYEPDPFAELLVEFIDQIAPSVIAAGEEFSVQASLPAGSSASISFVEFSLDQITWFSADNTFTYSGLGPLEVGEYLLYARVNESSVVSFNFSVQEREVTDEFGYYFLNPSWVGNTVNIYGLEDNTTITIDGISQTIDFGDNINYTVARQGEYISADKQFSIGTDAPSLDMPVPLNFLGTEFAIPHVRNTHYYDILSPNADAEVQITINGVAETVSLTQGAVFRYFAGSTAGDAGIVTSNEPILLSHTTPNGFDTYPVPPAATEIWGVRSRSVAIGALYDNTTIAVYASDGSSETVTINANDLFSVTAGRRDFQGRGSAIFITASRAVAAVQYGDGDGSESSAFSQQNLHASRFVIPVDTQYAAISCSETSNIVLYDTNGDIIESATCSTDGLSPGKVYFGSNQSGANITAGTSIVSSAPIYVMYEAAYSQNENNLLGTDAGALVNVSYVNNGGPLSTNDEFIALVSPSIGNESNISGVEFSIDGVNWSVGQLVDNTYQFNFGALSAGDYTLFVRVNSDQISNLTFSVSQPSLNFDYGYYFLNPSWVGNTVNIYGLEDNTTITIDGISQTIDFGDNINYTVARQGEYISADKQFSIGTDAPSLDMPVPLNFLGTEFAIPHVRNTHYYDILSPNADAEVQITINGVAETVSLTQGAVFRYFAGSTAGDAGIVTSNEPILLSHTTPNGFDTYPVPPAATEIWGVRSRSVAIGALYDNTTIAVYASDGSSETVTINANDLFSVTAGRRDFQGRGSAIFITASRAVAAVQYGDGDGSESSAFSQQNLHASRFVIPVDTQYAAISCSETSNIVLHDTNGDIIESATCSTDGLSPGKVYFGSNQSGANITAGTSIVSSAPIYVMYEAAYSQNENNLLGTNTNM